MAPARLHVLIATTLLSAGLAPAAGSASVSAREPRAPASEDAIVAYRSSGAWDRDLALLTDQARERLQATIVPPLAVSWPARMRLFDVQSPPLPSLSIWMVPG